MQPFARNRHGPKIGGGWMDQDATWYGGRPRPRPHCITWGPSSPRTQRGTAACTFRAMSIVTKRSPISATAELLLLFGVAISDLNVAIFAGQSAGQEPLKLPISARQPAGHRPAGLTDRLPVGSIGSRESRPFPYLVRPWAFRLMTRSHRCN